MSDFSALIEMLEAAPAGSRDLSDEVLLACGWAHNASSDPRNDYWRDPQGRLFNCYWEPRWSPPENGETSERPSPTESLDAAVALIPPGWFCNLDIAPEGTSCSATLDANDGVMLGRAARVVLGQSITPALALCAAILKARSSA